MSRLNRVDGAGRTISIALCAAAAAMALAAVSCIKQKDSLVIVGMTAEMTIPGPIQVRVSVGPVTQTFDLPAGLVAAMPTERGIYLDSKTTGSQVVNATTQGGTPCLIYTAMPQQTVVIGSAGETQTVSLTLVHSGTCSGNADSGAGGTGGNAGSGAGGTGTGGTTTNNDAGSDRPGTGGGPGTGGSPGLGGNGAAGAGAGGNGAGGSGPGGAAGNGPPSLAPATCHEFVHSVGTDCTVAANDTTIYTVSVSPNGTLVASAGNDGRTKIWHFDGHTLTPEGHVLQGGGFAVTAFSPDGSMLAIGWSTGIDIYSTSTWIRARTLTTSGQVYDLGFTPDGQQILSIDQQTLYAHAVTTPAALHSMPIPELTWASAVSPAATTTPVVAVATQTGTVRVFTHSASGFASAGPTLTVDTAGNKTLTVKFSPDGKLLAAAANDGNGLVHLWNYPLISATPTQPDIDILTPADSDDANALDFHPSGKYLGVGAGFFQAVGIFNTAAPRSIVSLFSGPSNDLISLTFSPNGAAVLGGEADCGLIVVCAD